MLTFVGVALFCLLSLLTPDTALLTAGEKLNVPFAGPVSFRGLMVLGPALLIMLRIYLQIYVEHWRRLENAGAEGEPLTPEPVRALGVPAGGGSDSAGGVSRADHPPGRSEMVRIGCLLLFFVLLAGCGCIEAAPGSKSTCYGVGKNL
jgi:hypothetical protein